MATNLQRVWEPWLPEGFVAPLACGLADAAMLEFMQTHNRKSLIATWPGALLEWDRSGKKAARPDISKAFGYSGSLCFRQSMVRQLFPQSPNELEFLPARLDGEEWVLLNCLRVIRSVDLASSDLEWVEHADSPSTIWRMHWINVVDPDASQRDVFSIPVSSDPEAYRRVLVTDVFVDRVRSLNLRGLEFKHVGYIVAEASQAVPKPPAPPPPPPKPSKRKPPKLTSGPLPADEQIEIATVGADWRKRLKLSGDASPETTLQRLTEEMHKLRPMFWTISAEERIDASLGLSAIYGELLRSKCGWSWAELRESRSKHWIAMLAPSGTHALALLPYVQQQIQFEAPTVKLLFNMIVVGQLPPAESGQLVLIG